MAGTTQIPCSHTFTAALPGCPAVLASRAKVLSFAAQRRSQLAASTGRGQSFHVEIEVAEDEDPEGVYKRFRNSCNLSGMVYEARRRKHFENPQDIKKRKQQEKGLRKMRDVRERFLLTYDDAHTENPPFSELFAEDEDIYNVLDTPFDEASKSGPTPAGGRANGNANVIMRSVPSLGPKASSGSGGRGERANGKPKAQVDTARNRRAAKKKAGAAPRK